MDIEKMGKEWGNRNKSVLVRLFKAYRIPLDADTILGWYMALGDLSDDDLQVAIIRALRENKDFPTPSAIRQYAPSTQVMTDKDRATMAWSSVLKAMRVHGGYKSVDFSDRLINATIREMGGWERLCDKTTDELVWAEKEFTAKYQVIGRTGSGDGSPLPGISERENSSSGRAIGLPEPVDCKVVAHCMAGRLTYEQHAAKLKRLAVVQHASNALTGIGHIPQAATAESTT